MWAEWLVTKYLLASLVENKSEDFCSRIYKNVQRAPAQVGCMRQVLRAGALARPGGMGWERGRKGGSGWGTRVDPWLIHVSVWQKTLQYCKVISFQLIKINEKKKRIYRELML